MADFAPRFRQTLRWRVFATFLAIFTLGFVSLFFVSQRLVQLQYDTTKQQTHAEVADHLAARIQKLLDEGRPFGEIQQVGEDVAQIDPDIALFILDEQGMVRSALSPHSNLMPGYQDIRIPVEPLESFLNGALNDLPLYSLEPLKQSKKVFSVARLRFSGIQGYLYVTLDGGQPFFRADGVSRENSVMLRAAFFVALCYLGPLALGLCALYFVSRRFRLLITGVARIRDGSFESRLPISKNDEIDALAHTINEMAERIQSDILILHERDETRRELISNVSHDLRSPATQIRLAAHALERVSREADARSHIAGINASVDFLDLMLRELSELGRLESASMKVTPEVFSIAELFADLELQYHLVAQEKQVSLLFSVPEDLPAVFADPALILRLMGNLIGNAIRYTPPGGTVRVAAAASSGAILLSVSDTGVGIRAEEMPHLFERFYRGADSRPAIPGSTGLGLAISKRIIDLHESAIEVESLPEQGTTFRFNLKTAAQQASSYVDT